MIHRTAQDKHIFSKMSDSRQNPNQDNHFEDDYTSEYDNRGFGSAIVESVKQKPLGYAGKYQQFF